LPTVTSVPEAAFRAIAETASRARRRVRAAADPSPKVATGKRWTARTSVEAAEAARFSPALLERMEMKAASAEFFAADTAADSKRMAKTERAQAVAEGEEEKVAPMDLIRAATAATGIMAEEEAARAGLPMKSHRQEMVAMVASAEAVELEKKAAREATVAAEVKPSSMVIRVVRRDVTPEEAVGMPEEAEGRRWAELFSAIPERS